MSRYDLFRRRIAPIAFVLAMGLLIRESCQKEQRTHATVQIDLPATKAQIVALDADVKVGTDTFGHLHREAAGGLAIDARPLTFNITIPEDDGELWLDLELTGGVHKPFVRRFHASEGATIRIAISDADLALNR